MQDSLSYIILVLIGFVIYLLITLHKNKEEPKELIGNKTVYSVQLGSYMQKIADELTKGFDNIWFKTTKQGTYIYYSGEFSSPEEATSHMYDLMSQGYSNIFITTVTK